ncbi:Uncharacterised protein [Salmonella enterica subsp. enterica]|uniref:Uncharacterized protein n=1 Tax=Salmonella enterica I TaxID=59201 RepID=A0A379WNU7_SALET|nr:Uncharacterised protein [Salmonella enterica subsp. enterica]
MNFKKNALPLVLFASFLLPDASPMRMTTPQMFTKPGS